MPTITLDLKPSHAPIKKYYETLLSLAENDAKNEGNIEHVFIELLNHCARKMGDGWAVIPKRPVRVGKRDLVPDATIILQGATVGYWEAKDSSDELQKEIKAKFAVGYPKDNILFWEPRRIALYQDGGLRFGPHSIEPGNEDNLVHALKQFFQYSQPHIEQWKEAVEEFKQQVPKLAQSLKQAIEKERKKNKPFIEAFDTFFELCRQAINPDLAVDAVEGMLIQHLLVERIFRKIFDDPDFMHRNAIAAEIERVIATLTFNREQFLRPYDYFYRAIEENAANAKDYIEKQSILNTVYERFFQGWSVKEADTLGIVYTPQPVVDFMVKSVEELLQVEFDRSLGDEGVHILDPFVGTGNFMVRLIKALKPSQLRHKYENELHCNEVMLMPYYIACMNIEQRYHESNGQYLPFPGICLVDTFDIRRQSLMFAKENTRRIQRQNEQPIFVIIGNPPYNAWQVTENDNNKNRKYEELDERVLETYGFSSRATNKSALADMYVKAFRWATDRVGTEEGVVAFVSNNGFLEGISFDGFRKNLLADFSAVYHLNMKGNARTSGSRRQREGGNVFNDLIRVGVGITLLVRKKSAGRAATISYCEVDDYVTAEGKQDWLVQLGSLSSVPWIQLVPDEQGNWLHTQDQSYSSLVPMGVKGESIGTFAHYSLAPNTARDAWVFSFSPEELRRNTSKMIAVFNGELDRYEEAGRPEDVDSFVLADPAKISWSRDLKNDLTRGVKAKFEDHKIRQALYRPFTAVNYFFDRVLNEEVYQFPSIFPDSEAEDKNRVICVTSVGSEKPFLALACNIIPNYHLTGAGSGTQCFPFLVYDERGRASENINDTTLEAYRTHYKDKKITKWDIFYYTYAVLHDPVYRERYAANLKRELPRIPYAPDFHAYAKAGKRLAEIHIDYEKQKPFKLKTIEKQPFKWRVEKMRLSKDKKTLTYNECLTLTDIPPQVYEYRLGNRSALEWVVDQYQVSTDKRSGIVNDPNRADDPEYIYNLIRKVVTVSLETVSIVKNLPGLGLPEAEKAASVQ